MRFSVFDANGDLLATNQYFSVGGGFVVNQHTQGWFAFVDDPLPFADLATFLVDENLYFRSIKKDEASNARRDQSHGISDSLGLPAPAATHDEPKKPKGGTGKQPPFLFTNGASLLSMSQKHNVRPLISPTPNRL